ncbi:MAG TPA: SusD/RagB family nutrient-binding outer membrane lipoprotein, partial [Saprospiraceae bacterium]|nr:SusD/RagB family nutrient-binding outer membrane lipoprotein [Saprospiraceae bacterium]
TGAPAPQAYIDDQASEDLNSITMAKIMTHKYVAMFTQQEVWTDWRRTGIPSLSPNPNGAANGVTSIPRRLPTSQEERNYNTNAQVQQDITVPVWWDE